MHARTIIYMYVCASTHMQAHTCARTHTHTHTQNIHIPSLLIAQYGSHDLKRDKRSARVPPVLLQ